MSTEISFVEAITQALAYELAHDDRVVLLGEDIGKNGGVFRATLGLLDRFGEGRVRDTPLAETMIAGLAVGMATQGLRPVAEFQFMGFIYPGFDHIVSHAARMRNRTRGRLSCPLVMRTPYGAGIHAPEHHSESTEAYFAHTPGLKVVVPSSPAKAYRLLLAAIRDPDPVVFLEPTRLYRLFKQVVPDDGEALPLEKAFLLREGEHITLISWGAMLHETLQAAACLAEEGISAEVMDVATLKPIDMVSLENSVRKTGRCVIIHEAARFCGVGAEIAASLAESCFFDLQAPIARITAADVVIPYPILEHAYLPSVQHIVHTAQQMMEHA